MSYEFVVDAGYLAKAAAMKLFFDVFHSSVGLLAISVAALAGVYFAVNPSTSPILMWVFVAGLAVYDFLSGWTRFREAFPPGTVLGSRFEPTRMTVSLPMSTETFAYRDFLRPRRWGPVTLLRAKGKKTWMSYPSRLFPETELPRFTPAAQVPPAVPPVFAQGFVPDFTLPTSPAAVAPTTTQPALEQPDVRTYRMTVGPDYDRRMAGAMFRFQLRRSPTVLILPVSFVVLAAFCIAIQQYGFTVLAAVAAFLVVFRIRGMYAGALRSVQMVATVGSELRTRFASDHFEIESRLASVSYLYEDFGPPLVRAGLIEIHDERSKRTHFIAPELFPEAEFGRFGRSPSSPVIPVPGAPTPLAPVELAENAVRYELVVDSGLAVREARAIWLHRSPLLLLPVGIAVVAIAITALPGPHDPIPVAISMLSVIFVAGVSLYSFVVTVKVLRQDRPGSVITSVFEPDRVTISSPVRSTTYRYPTLTLPRARGEFIWFQEMPAKRQVVYPRVLFPDAELHRFVLVTDTTRLSSPDSPRPRPGTRA